MLRVDTAPLFDPLLLDLTTLLGALEERDWMRDTQCPRWTVHGVASHLLGVELGNVSGRRDGWWLQPSENEDPDRWLNAFNDDWVRSCERLSPKTLVHLLRTAGEEFNRYVRTLDPDALGQRVSWATGDQRAPVWLDIAREFMERAVHQQQIRWAIGGPPLEDDFVTAVLATAVHALPIALAGQSRPAGETVSFVVEGSGGGSWFVVSTGDRWTLAADAGDIHACEVKMSAETALKLFVRDPSADPFSTSGDATLAEAVAQVKAVLG